eukprot:scaffold20054_cov63-Phaeocystis_antarctica.AAC.2
MPSMMDSMRLWLTLAPKRFHERQPSGGVRASPLSLESGSVAKSWSMMASAQALPGRRLLPCAKSLDLASKSF